MARWYTYEMLAIVVLALAALGLHAYNNVLGVPTNYGITLDLAGIPILLAYFLFGFSAALYALVLLTIGIVLSSSAGWKDAGMAFSLILPVLLALVFYEIVKTKGARAFKYVLLIFIASALAVIIADYSALSKAVESKELAQALPLLIIACFSFMLVKLAEFTGYDYDEEVFRKLSSLASILVIAVVICGVVGVVWNVYYIKPVYFGYSIEQVIASIQNAGIPFASAKALPWYWKVFGWSAAQALVSVLAAWIIAYKFGLIRNYETL
ncbi:MAG: hypothetical protein ABIH99_01215 [Candidatus Micrarchaeota archaeon]